MTKPIKAWAILDEKGKPLDIKFYKPSKNSYFNIGTWTYPITGHKIILVLITPISKKKGKKK